MSRIFESLNKEQRSAIEQIQGPVLIFAGAGSGKTRVITHKIAHLLETGAAKSWEILALTFTNKAAQEMRNRVNALVQIESMNFWIGTFHSISARILRIELPETGGNGNFTIYDRDDQKRIIKQILKDPRMGKNRNSVQKNVKYISCCKENLVTPENALANASNPYEQSSAEIYNRYEKELSRSNAYDFDDLMLKTFFLFQNYPMVREKYSARFKYIMVDEYQDTNHIQYKLVNALSSMHGNITVVGDDDQSIYSWRGADIRNILEFERDFPETKIFKLEQNYRSTPIILKAANNVINYNRYRKAKEMWTEKQGGERILVASCIDEKHEATQVLEAIKASGDSHDEWGVFYRTHAQSRALEDMLRRSSVPYRIYGGIRFYERMEIKDILAYLRLTVNPMDNLSLLRIINIPHRGIGNRTIDKITVIAEHKGLTLWQVLEGNLYINEVNAGSIKRIKDFTALVAGFMAEKERIKPAGLIAKIIEESGYHAVLEQEDTDDSAERIRNLEELVSAADDFYHAHPHAMLEDFLHEISLFTNIDNFDSAAKTVSLMTLHSAKGLEFRNVAITGLEQGLFPMERMNSDENDFEEERRLFYVGITRAKERVMLSYAVYRKQGMGGLYRSPSCFLNEIPEEYKKTTGDSALHGNSFSGSIKPAENRNTTVIDNCNDYQVGSVVQHPLWG
ncbi:MAG: UvrD-helicase domain-containing protein, partial [bacterium]